MALYEHVFLARQDLTQQQVDQVTEQYKAVIEAQGGKIGRVEQWGLRPLAYRIKKNRKAYYILMNIDASGAAMAEMERQMGINEDILRFLTLRVEEFNDTPSPIMSRRDRDDRFRDRDEERPRRQRRPRSDNRNADNAADKGE
ncbi:MAG: 30S ribosomal protein S6 [Candidatus Tokpelaia sp.]|uniref:30S ribosomal protein S6 n=1 Tax=Candidatus Tokpelaia sp. TaxID=2233777 RepID=UPI001239A6BF|nr:30S ribosomal protein S6 [Candidatus Tokpelaia sp.]KAA6206652.1 MAG: 30S ribosomal protein S6 [Candidatus Tokpelaia sp.]KAA6206947.1 MAG: 30S ribosomal protein S6 [Candidatus Tokpelaia sp.]KAA6405537.1 30S ribosomal protein S6 [Candidatus Tokpelaia sp.]